MKKIPILFLGLLGGLAACTRIPPAIAPDKKIETRIGELLQKMTLEEKIGQMCQLTAGVVIDQSDPQHPVFSEALLDQVIGRYKVGSILNIPFGVGQPREVWARFINCIQQRSLDELGIPCIYGVDQIHGASYTQGATLFPQGINMGASFNRGLMRRCSEISAYETRACAIPWTFAPVMDLGRDPRWPRMWESYGEGTYVNSQMAVASVLGFQGDDPNRVDDRHVAACIKHFMAYGVPVSGKDRTPSSVTRNVLREKYFAPFMECIRAGALSLMVNSASNGGMPFHADRELLTGWIKEELDWDGLIVTDWNDIYNLCERDHIAASRKDAVRIAVNAGIDMSMVPSSWDFCIYLRELVEEGQVSMERIDDAVSRVLRLKFRLGLFEKPFWDTGDFPEFASDEYAAVALQAAVESEILLKNEDGLLPLERSARILLTGPNANSMRCLNGGWSYSWQGDRCDEFAGDYNTIYEALCNKFDHVDYVPGVEYAPPRYDNWQEECVTGIDKAVSAAAGADVIIACIGENSYCETPGNMDDLNLSQNQKELVRPLAATGKPLVLILNEGRPRVIGDIEPLAQAVVDILLPGNYGGDALAERLQQAMTDYVQKQLAPYLQQAMDQVMKAISEQIASTVSSQLKAGAAGLMDQVATQMSSSFANLASAMRVDASAFAHAIHFNMDAEDLSSLMMSYAKASKLTYDNNLTTLGYADEADPISVKIFPRDFEAKERVLDHIGAYNKQVKASGHDEQAISYTDYMGIIMGSVTDIVNTISLVLIAFVSISLVVSSIMIGIITYISVLERKKEIGILRAIGASKRNVANVFNAETFIEGLIAGVFAVVVAMAVSFPVNAWALAAKQVPNLMSLPVQDALMLIAISVLLTVVAGLLPARSASKKDPVEALRSE